MTGTIENRSKFLETLFEKRGGVELPFEPYVPISDLRNYWILLRSKPAEFLLI